MGLVLAGIILTLLGLIAGYPLLIKQFPSWEKLIDKLIPYQGYVGIVGLGSGVIAIIVTLIGIKDVNDQLLNMLGWLFSMLRALCLLLLGYLSSYSLITNTFLQNNYNAVSKMDRVKEKLAPHKINLGLLSLALGLLAIISGIIGW